MVCENPNCVPKVECCSCNAGAPKVSQPFPFFKETETNQGCCGCQAGRSAPSEIPQITAANPAQFNTMPSSGFINTGNHLLKIENTASIEMLKQPVVLGTTLLTGAHHPNTQEFGKEKVRLNLDMMHRDKY